MLFIDATLPIIGGVGEGVKVFVELGGTVVRDGVKVAEGSGVREGIGVAVKRGVMLTIGASVAVGAVTISSVAFPLQPASKMINTKIRSDLFRITSLHKT